MVLICISMMPNKVEHLFMCLLALSFSVKFRIKSIVPFSIGLPAFFLLVCRYSYIVWRECFVGFGPGHTFPFLPTHPFNSLMPPSTILSTAHPFPAVGLPSSLNMPC